MAKLNYLLAILILALILRVVSLNQSLWLDEATTALVARDYGFNEVFSWFIRADFHPPLYYILVKIFTGIIGNFSEIALRVPSIIFGLVNIVVVYKIGEFLKDKKTGLMAALLLAVAPLHIYYSQEARMYSLAAMLATLAFYFYLKKRFIFFSAVLALGLWADYMVIFIVPVFLFLPRNRIFTLLSLVFSLPMLLFLPSQLSIGAGVSPNWANLLGETNIKNTLLIPVKFIIGRISFDNNIFYFLIVALPAFLIAYLLLQSFMQDKKQRLLWYWLITPVIVGLVVGIFIPVVSYFRFLYVLPAMYILISLSKSKFIYILIVLNLAFSAIYLFNPKFHREDWRGLVSYVESASEGDTKVIFPANSQMEAYKYYAKKDNFSGPEGINKNLEKIWLIRYVYDIVDPEDKARVKVEELGFKKQSEMDFTGVVLFKYEKPSSKSL